MKLNISKCSKMQVGKNNNSFAYSINEHRLKGIDKEEDLGITIDNSFKFRTQCIEARNKANKTLGFINKNVSYKSKEVIKSLYNSYVRPHLEYCVQVWKPHFKQDIQLLESVQRRRQS